MKAVNRALVVVFLALIAIPGIGLALGVDRSNVSEAEMRELATLPALTWDWQVVAGFQQYFSDHFSFRSRLIHAQAWLLLNVFGASASPTVIPGRDGWLFYADDGGLEDWTQAEPFTDAEMEVWRQVLEARRRWLARQGIPYFFVIAPDKQMIYPELMPASLQRMRADYRADQLIAYLRAHSDFRVLDLRPVVLAHKHDGEPLYHRYDTHWNDRGGLVGYQEMIRGLRQWFPEMRPLTRADFTTSPAVPSGDKTTMLGLVDAGKGAMPGLVPVRGWRHRVVFPAHPDPYGEEGTLVTEIPGSRLPRAVMFRDSFAGRLIPYLSEHFSRVTYVWQNMIDPDLIRRETPDVVIQEMVARHFYRFGPYIDVPK